MRCHTCDRLIRPGELGATAEFTFGTFPICTECAVGNLTPRKKRQPAYVVAQETREDLETYTTIQLDCGCTPTFRIPVPRSQEEITCIKCWCLAIVQ